MFILRMAFWLGLAAVIVPGNPLGSFGRPDLSEVEPVDARELAALAEAVWTRAVNIGEACVEAPEACAAVAELGADLIASADAFTAPEEQEPH